MALIEKIEVTDGIFWISVKDANLKILCSSPADTVKHLMKRGLIHKRSLNGVVFETGPNVILLSDIMLQNGEFSNLSEFPILQMLYRQGMIIPNHPNNTGKKPLIVGSREQVKSQLEYIYRGNYGLVSKEEIIATGFSAEKANELMNMKLKFAFGEIKKTEEFVDSKIIDDGKIEIQNGVYIERKSVNVFEISYKEESIVVDLNLKKNQKYIAPYPMGFFNLNREFFSVVHSGSGDGWDFDRPTMSSVVIIQGKVYLVDAGPNILNVLISLGIGIGEVEGVFHTHSHDDHFAGLTALIRSGQKIKYYATPLVRDSVIKKMSALLNMEESSFYNYFDVVDLPFDKWQYIDGFDVKAVFSPHPVETNFFIFRVLCKDGYKTYGHLADIVSLNVLKMMIREGDDTPGISQAMFDKTKESYLKPRDLKKIDIGGGMIHGEALDFVEDESGKIILAHTSTPLSMEAKEIGSSASLGVEDILLPSYQDFDRKKALDFFNIFFPEVDTSQIRVLLNNPVVTFNPEYILLRRDQTTEYVYLILTGNVEVLQSKAGTYEILSSGAIVGEIPGILGIRPLETYRAASYVKALKIPASIYKQFVKDNSLYKDIESLQDNIKFLLENKLFSESIPYQIQHKIAKTMKFHIVESGEEIVNDKKDLIFCIVKGEVELSSDEKVVETISTDDFFAEECAFIEKSKLTYTTQRQTHLFEIPSSILVDIPIVRWKLYEEFRRRKAKRKTLSTT